MLFLKKTDWRISLIILAFIFADLTIVKAAWFGDGALAVPQSTEELNRSKRETAGMIFEMINYKSQLSKSDISAFYQDKLSKDGWELRNLLKEAKQVPILHLNQDQVDMLGTVLLFQKRDLLFTVNFLPDSIKQESVFYSVSRLVGMSSGKAAESGIRSNQDFFSVSELLTKPKKQFAPVYPGAKLNFISEDERLSVLQYISPDSVEKISQYYREHMASHGWDLVSEKPIEFKDLPTGIDPQSCPSCAQKNAEFLNNTNMPQSMQKESTVLIFNNKNQARCEIAITSLKINREVLNLPAEYTTIMLNYYDAK